MKNAQVNSIKCLNKEMQFVSDELSKVNLRFHEIPDLVSVERLKQLHEAYQQSNNQVKDFNPQKS